jgi:ParB family chromosome partitioning protein
MSSSVQPCPSGWSSGRRGAREMSTLFGDEISTTQGKKSNEWYTPSVYIKAAREVLGSIDLDPASCEQANKTVKATRYYTKEENGLALPWYGRMYVNPPFTASSSIAMPQFTWGKRLVEEYQKGTVEQAILLVMACVKQKWFHILWDMHDYPVCFNHKRIHFIRPNQTTQELRESTCFIYLGPNEAKFIDVFSRFGTIAKRVSVSKPAQVVQHDLWSNGSEVA